MLKKISKNYINKSQKILMNFKILSNEEYLFDLIRWTYEIVDPKKL
ncbi:MAG: hypothetical protein N3D74_03825 [Caldisericia bacterium]|nr:hypothetical protein [Caldisericia bacterium]